MKETPDLKEWHDSMRPISYGVSFGIMIGAVGVRHHPKPTLDRPWPFVWNYGRRSIPSEPVVESCWRF